MDGGIVRGTDVFKVAFFCLYIHTSIRDSCFKTNLSTAYIHTYFVVKMFNCLYRRSLWAPRRCSSGGRCCGAWLTLGKKESSMC